MHNRTGESTDFVEFLLDEVNYIDLWPPTNHSSEVPTFHTSQGSFVALSTIKDISVAFAKFGFESYDRSSVINVERIKELEPVKSGTKVIFDDDSYVFVRKSI